MHDVWIARLQDASRALSAVRARSAASEGERNRLEEHASILAGETCRAASEGREVVGKRSSAQNSLQR